MLIRFNVTFTNNTIGPLVWQFDPDEILEIQYIDDNSSGVSYYNMVIVMRDAEKNKNITFTEYINRDIAFDDLWNTMMTTPIIPENKFYQKEYKDNLLNLQIQNKE